MAIGSIKALRTELQYAMKVEHSTIPPYLCALYSIPDGTNDEAVAVIQTVAMEEMLHMVLVANLTNAVGGETCVNDPKFVPRYPGPLPRCLPWFLVELQRFSPEALDLFLRIERPDAIPENARTAKRSAKHEYATIGEFYGALRHALKNLVDQHGEQHVFSGRPELQVTPEYYYGGSGELFVIHSLEDAERAISEIVEQGEGLPGQIGVQQVRSRETAVIAALSREVSAESDFLPERFGGDSEPAHYFRFKEIRDGRYYQKGDTIDSGPRGPELPVDWNAVFHMQSNPSASDYGGHPPVQALMNDFNDCYQRLLERLQLAFTGQPSSLVATVGDMLELKHRAVELMRIPNPLDNGATTVGPPFGLGPTM